MQMCFPPSHAFNPVATQCLFAAVSDAGIFDADVLEARQAKEAAAVAAWHRNTASIHT